MAKEPKSSTTPLLGQDFPTVVASSDGATGLEVIRFIGSEQVRNQDATGYYFQVRYAPGADVTKLGVVFDNMAMAFAIKRADLGIPELVNKSDILKALSLAAIGDSLDEYGHPPVVESGKPAPWIQWTTERFEPRGAEQASGDEQIEAYLRGHLYWSWRFFHSQWVFGPGDKVRVAQSLTRIHRLASLGEDVEWEVLDASEAYIVLAPTKELIRAERESRTRAGEIEGPLPQMPEFRSWETVEGAPNRTLKFELEISTSSGFEVQRETSDSQHVPLDTDQYAAALEKVIRSAKGDFMFALLGPWGRGKSYLARQIAKRLQEGDNDDGHYAVAWFSAWKYPRTPETWVHLYQTFLKTAPSDFFGRTGVLIRQNIFKHGIWGVVLVILTLALTIMPLSLRLDLLSGAVSVLGVAGLVGLATWMGGLQRAYNTLRKRYLLRETYDAHLGLQSAIGDDLRDLLRALIPRKSAFGPGWPGRIAMVSGVAAVTLALATWLNASPLAATIGFGIWALIVGGLGLVSVNAGRGVGRILLVMDDLDRCDTKQQTAIIEAVRLLLEDEEIHDRVQVLVLAEEEAIRQSVLARYSHIPGVEDQKNRQEQLLFEVFEKLFIGHLRLPPLTEASVREMAKGVLRGRVFRSSSVPSPEAHADEEAGSEALARTDEPGQPVTTDVEESQQSKEPSVGGQPDSSEGEQAIYIYTSAEGTALEEAVVSLETVTGVPTTPRAVRSFEIRYQLARELLQGGTVPGPDEICEALLEGYKVRYGRKEESDLSGVELQLMVVV